jgi:hypothetical protein
MLTSVDARRRWFGTFFLIVAGGMLVWGFTFLAAALIRRPMLFVIYWITCLAFTLLSFAIAVYDMHVIRKRVREEKKSAFNKAFSDIVDDNKQ